jgi:hypothetical protein
VIRFVQSSSVVDRGATVWSVSTKWATSTSLGHGRRRARTVPSSKTLAVTLLTVAATVIVRLDVVAVRDP